jgi:hypothetical protein
VFYRRGGDRLDVIEERDVLTFTTTEFLTYCADLQSECRWQRRLLHEALAHVARLTDRLQHATREIEEQRAA